MIKNVDIKSLMEKEVTRKQFITHIGVALLALVGVPAFLKNLQSIVSPSITNNITNELSPKAGILGYGESAYAGNPNQKGRAN